MATPEGRDDADLAGRILKTAKSLKKKLKLRSVLLEKAYELGIRHRDGYGSAAEAARMLAALDPGRAIESQRKLVQVLQLGYTASRTTGARRAAGEELAKAILALAEMEAQAGRWPQVEGLHRRALVIAQAIDSPMQREVLERMWSRTRLRLRTVCSPTAMIRAPTR